jgi:hypothetical protein
MLISDPLDPEAQRFIKEEIQKKNIQRYMKHALEYSPQVFASVTMFYINLRVSRTLFKTLVNSGTQRTIMNLEATKKCNLSHLIVIVVVSLKEFASIKFFRLVSTFFNILYHANIIPCEFRNGSEGEIIEISYRAVIPIIPVIPQ